MLPNKCPHCGALRQTLNGGAGLVFGSSFIRHNKGCADIYGALQQSLGQVMHDGANFLPASVNAGEHA